MKLSKEHKTAIVVAIIMLVILYFVNFVRDGTSW
jgi:hypothetical protein